MIDPRCDSIGVGVTISGGRAYCQMYAGDANSHHPYGSSQKILAKKVFQRRLKGLPFCQQKKENDMKKFHFSAKRMIAALLALVCLLGLLPTAAFAVSPGTITLTKCDQTK